MVDINFLRFLIVDDMMVMRKIYKKSLTSMNVDLEMITEAEDGAKAWEEIESAYASSKPIQFIISDWNMPNMTGIDLLKKIRSDQRFPKLPFLMVTAENNPDNIKEALEAGVDNFIAKPFRPEDLVDRIKSIHSKLSSKS